MIATSIVITGHNVTGMSFMAFHFMLDLLSCINDKDNNRCVGISQNNHGIEFS